MLQVSEAPLTTEAQPQGEPVKEAQDVEVEVVPEPEPEVITCDASEFCTPEKASTDEGPLEPPPAPRGPHVRFVRFSSDLEVEEEMPELCLNAAPVEDETKPEDEAKPVIRPPLPPLADDAPPCLVAPDRPLLWHYLRVVDSVFGVLLMPFKFLLAGLLLIGMSVADRVGLGHRLLPPTCRAFLRLGGYQLVVHGREHLQAAAQEEGPLVAVFNYRSPSDCLSVMGAFGADAPQPVLLLPDADAEPIPFLPSIQSDMGFVDIFGQSRRAGEAPLFLPANRPRENMQVARLSASPRVVPVVIKTFPSWNAAAAQPWEGTGATPWKRLLGKMLEGHCEVHVTALPALQRGEDEPEDVFARRVQTAMASAYEACERHQDDYVGWYGNLMSSLFFLVNALESRRRGRGDIFFALMTLTCTSLLFHSSGAYNILLVDKFAIVASALLFGWRSRRRRHFPVAVALGLAAVSSWLARTPWSPAGHMAGVHLPMVLATRLAYL